MTVVVVQQPASVKEQFISFVIEQFSEWHRHWLNSDIGLLSVGQKATTRSRLEPFLLSVNNQPAIQLAANEGLQRVLTRQQKLGRSGVRMALDDLGQRLIGQSAQYFKVTFPSTSPVTRPVAQLIVDGQLNSYELSTFEVCLFDECYALFLSHRLSAAQAEELPFESRQSNLSQDRFAG